MKFFDSLKSVLKSNINDNSKESINEILNDHKNQENIFSLIDQEKRRHSEIKLQDGSYIIGTLFPQQMEFKFNVLKNKITKIQCIVNTNLFSSDLYLNLYETSIAFMINSNETAIGNENIDDFKKYLCIATE